MLSRFRFSLAGFKLGLWTALAVFVSWIAVLAVVMVLSDAAPGAIAVTFDPGFVAGLPKGMALVGAGPGWVAIKSDAAQLGQQLYAQGAWLVLPAGLPGCLPLPNP